ncbi:hypothetical protein GUF72_03735 [Xanthomonas citri pv. citri]|uniref:Uncharacterized protein n=2 Tax=Xanthomonas citri TaxID=346 RepID=A0A0U5FHR6_XANCI|nr:hypothetical protein [Xanthomonas citri]MBD1522880.1 hypothetical protein [Xanthomonas citri pv. citri]MBD1529297.1 hypothetical protein [Xanthomonas citri pv. citri]MBD1563373.1 hypothetical protein [Xanthomonas citri pv. citri]MBD3957792.1 hypothetical protein [Xanthomonas citri pv. citri]MBD3977593.1 hypothetical protein [Xanthomonas citri pv. citri]
MNAQQFWTCAALAALSRTTFEQAAKEADGLLAIAQDRDVITPPSALAPRESGWVGNRLFGWPTPEDMKRVVRADGTDYRIP